MLPDSLSRLNTVLFTIGYGILVAAPHRAFLITLMATNLRLDQGHDKDRTKVMYWTMVNNLLLGTNMDTQVFHPGIVKVIVSGGNSGC
jgi:hypothetical protein